MVPLRFPSVILIKYHVMENLTLMEKQFYESMFVAFLPPPELKASRSVMSGCIVLETISSVFKLGESPLAHSSLHTSLDSRTVRVLSMSSSLFESGEWTLEGNMLGSCRQRQGGLGQGPRCFFILWPFEEPAPQLLPLHVCFAINPHEEMQPLHCEQSRTWSLVMLCRAVDLGGSMEHAEDKAGGDPDLGIAVHWDLTEWRGQNLLDEGHAAARMSLWSLEQRKRKGCGFDQPLSLTLAFLLLFPPLQVSLLGGQIFFVNVLFSKLFKFPWNIHSYISQSLQIRRPYPAASLPAISKWAPGGSCSPADGVMGLVPANAPALRWPPSRSHVGSSTPRVHRTPHRRCWKLSSSPEPSPAQVHPGSSSSAEIEPSPPLHVLFPVNHFYSFYSSLYCGRQLLLPSSLPLWSIPCGTIKASLFIYF